MVITLHCELNFLNFQVNPCIPISKILFSFFSYTLQDEERKAEITCRLGPTDMSLRTVSYLIKKT